MLRDLSAPIVVFTLQIALLVCPGCNKKAEEPPAPVKPTTPREVPLADRFGELEKIADIAVPTGMPGLAFAISPNGDEYAVGGSDGSVTLVPRKGGEPRILVGHKEMVLEAIYTPDGQTLLTGGADNHLIIWDPVKGVIKEDIKAHNGDLKALAVTVDGTLVATGSVADDVRVWRIADGKRTAHFEGHSSTVYTVTWSFNGQYVFSGGRDAQVRRWSVEKGKSDAPPLAFRNTVVALQWSPGQETLYMVGLVGELASIDPIALKVLSSRRVGSSRITDMDVSTAGNIAIGERNGQVSVWSPDFKSEEPVVKPFAAHDGEIRQVRYVPKSGDLLTLGADNTIGLWDARTGAPKGPKKPLPSVNGVVRAVAANPKSTRAAIASEGKLFLVDALTAQAAPDSPDLGPGGVSSVAYTPDGKQLFVGRDNGHILVMSDSGKQVADHSVHTGTIRHIVPGASGKTVWTAGDDIIVNQLDAKTFEPTVVFKGHTSHIVALAADGQGKRVASAEENHITIIRYVETNNTQWVRRGLPVSHLAFSPDGNTLAMVENRRVIMLYDVEERRELKKLRGNPAQLRGMMYHPDGEMIVTIDNQGTVRAWSVESGAMIASANAGRGRPTALSLGDSGRLVLTGGMDPFGSAKIFRFQPKTTP